MAELLKKSIRNLDYQVGPVSSQAFHRSLDDELFRAFYVYLYKVDRSPAYLKRVKSCDRHGVSAAGIRYRPNAGKPSIARRPLVNGDRPSEI